MYTAEANALGGTKKGSTAKKTMTTTNKKLSPSSMYQTATKSSNSDISNKSLNSAYAQGGSGGSGGYVDATPNVDESYSSSYSRSGRGGSGSDGGDGYYEVEGYGADGSDWLQQMIDAQVGAAYSNYSKALQNAANAYNFQKGNTQNAYNTANQRIDTQWSKTADTLRKNLESTLGSLKENYDYGEGVQRSDANDSLTQAYINYMMNKRDMAQNLAAAGISGGATESSLANLYNNYGNSRNTINNTLAKNLAQLLNTYNNNVSSANRAYNSEFNTAQNNYTNYVNELAQNYASAMNQLEANYADYKNSYENNLYNALMGVYSGSSISGLANAFANLSSVSGNPMNAVTLNVPSIGALANEGAYTNTLAGLMNNMDAAALNYTPTENALGVDLYNTRQGSDLGSVTDYAKYLAMLEQMAG